MNLLKREILTQRKFIISPNKNQRNGSLVEFKPFENERDSIGRLITKESIELSKKNQQASTKNLVISKSKETESNNNINENINRFFRQKDIYTSLEQNKPKIIKRSLVHVLYSHHQVKTKQKMLTQIRENQEECRPSSKLTHLQLRKTFSVNLNKNRVPSIQKLQRKSTTILTTRNSSSSYAKNVNQTEVSPKKSSKNTAYYESKVIISEDIHNYPELKKYKRMKELQIKMHQDFEEKHELFIEKMLQSKQLAFQVKINLDKIDGFI